jgi:glycerophosphoryl diester phosphodiesterase
MPLTQAYAHGDCDHPRPLLDALDHGFCHVEADVWLSGGEILVAHDFCDTRPGRSLRSLYLEPLAARCGNGSVFDEPAEFTLLIDIKNEPEAMYAALCRELESFRGFLSEYRRGFGVTRRAVTILLSGDRPIQTVAGEEFRRVFLDGRLPDLEGPIDPDLMPWVSDNWEAHFAWRGIGSLPPGDRDKLTRLVREAHETGVKLRLWSAPDEPVGWRTLLDAGVDLLSTDRLAALSEFLDW